MPQPTSNRRIFLRSSLTAASAIAAGGAFRGAAGANDTIRVACVGLNKKGRSHLTTLQRLADKNVRIVALCDVDDLVLRQRTAEVEAETGTRPDAYRDIRKLLETPDIDAITIATPNHWHALMTLWACQAGKDVYVEKPASWCIREGRQMVAAARKYGRIVQVGTQARSFGHVRRAIHRMQSGLIGDVHMARGLCYKQRESIGRKNITAPPDHLDFDLWLGPAPTQPYHANIVHYNWHWLWDFGNGDIGNQGIHELDLARAVVDGSGPVRVHAVGGRFGYDDQGETPNTLNASFTHADGRQIVFEVRGRYTHAEQGVQIGNLYYGSEGYLAGANWGSRMAGYTEQDQTLANWLPRFGFGGKEYGGAPPKSGDLLDGPIHTGEFDEDYVHHFENFFDAIRSRDHRLLNADILEGHRSAMLMHAANLSYRLGETLTLDTEKEEFVGAGAAKANRFLTREYRKGFAVPELV